MATTTNGDAMDAGNESSYVKEMQKNIRNITKKLAASHKIDTVIADNPNLSLDELVAQKKINADQKAAALKKPQLQAQLLQLEDQISHYRKFETDSQSQLAKQKEELTTKHAAELESAREEGRKEALESSNSQLRSSLLLFSQFLRAAASKRAEEENAETEESKAFEGVLLLVYGGDQPSVDAALKIVEGSDDKAPGIDGAATTISYAQIKQASIEHSPFQTEEAWVDSVAEAQATTVTAGTDPTLINAGLTEQQDVLTNGVNPDAASQPLSETANAAAERWDSNPVSGGADSSALEESYEVIPRPDEEVDVPAHTAVEEHGNAQIIDTTEPTASASWDDQVPAYAAPPPSKPAAEGDGFQEVAGRSRGGRGRGGFQRGDGEHRGRGRGRGRGFGGRGRGDGEGRGRGGRGRGPRGDGPARG
ncbi:hypothetical protein AMS68_007049 [Peltaster fructicola]|uniref:YAG7-like dimerisation domain-containing protein n=1 Tax=Peltaster fructicola TaxID=286661 RepID=A0A6H0Y3D9_9PEZI|nr:hypothetical protein AMS68_007049 [Peltaster fructicola]